MNLVMFSIIKTKQYQGKILGYRILDIDNGDIRDLSIEQILTILHKGYTVHNLGIDTTKPLSLTSTNGKIERYPVVINNVVVHNANAIVIIGTNPDETLTVLLSNGKLCKVHTTVLINSIRAKNYSLANACLVQRDKTSYISPIIGTFPHNTEGSSGAKGSAKRDIGVAKQVGTVEASVPKAETSAAKVDTNSTQVTEIFLKEYEYNGSVGAGYAIQSYHPVSTTQTTQTPQDLIIPEGVKIIGRGVYSDRSFNTVHLPSTLREISEQAFANTSISNLEIEPGLVFIGRSAFNSCTNLLAITLPNTVTSIGQAAFYNCNSLETVNLPKALNLIGAMAFEKCTSLHHIIINAPKCDIKASAFRNSGLQTIEIKSVHSIDERILAYTGIKRIDLPATLKTIPAYSLDFMDELETVTIPEGATTFDLMCSTSENLVITCPNSIKRVTQYGRRCTTYSVATPYKLEVPFGSYIAAFLLSHKAECKIINTDENLINKQKMVDRLKLVNKDIITLAYDRLKLENEPEKVGDGEWGRVSPVNLSKLINVAIPERYKKLLATNISPGITEPGAAVLNLITGAFPLDLAPFSKGTEDKFWGLSVTRDRQLLRYQGFGLLALEFCEKTWNKVGTYLVITGPSDNILYSCIVPNNIRFHASLDYAPTKYICQDIIQAGDIVGIGNNGYENSIICGNSCICSDSDRIGFFKLLKQSIKYSSIAISMGTTEYTYFPRHNIVYKSKGNVKYTHLGFGTTSSSSQILANTTLEQSDLVNAQALGISSSRTFFKKLLAEGTGTWEVGAVNGGAGASGASNTNSLSDTIPTQQRTKISLIMAKYYESGSENFDICNLTPTDFIDLMDSEVMEPLEYSQVLGIRSKDHTSTINKKIQLKGDNRNVEIKWQSCAAYSHYTKPYIKNTQTNYIITYTDDDNIKYAITPLTYLELKHLLAGLIDYGNKGKSSVLDSTRLNLMLDYDHIIYITRSLNSYGQAIEKVYPTCRLWVKKANSSITLYIGINPLTGCTNLMAHGEVTDIKNGTTSFWIANVLPVLDLAHGIELLERLFAGKCQDTLTDAIRALDFGMIPSQVKPLNSLIENDIPQREHYRLLWDSTSELYRHVALRSKQFYHPRSLLGTISSSQKVKDLILSAVTADGLSGA